MTTDTNTPTRPVLTALTTLMDPAAAHVKVDIRAALGADILGAWDYTAQRVHDLLGFRDMSATELGVEVPAWVEGDRSLDNLNDIANHGCASGAYMPAVIYDDALSTMNRHGDAVLEYLGERLEYLELDLPNTSWAGMACTLVSAAVEAWAQNVYDEASDRSDEVESAYDLLVDTIDDLQDAITDWAEGGDDPGHDLADLWARMIDALDACYDLDAP